MPRNSDSGARNRSRRRKRLSQRGVVLLDLVLALAVIALAAYVLMPVPSGSLSQNDVKADAVRVAAIFRQARTDAIRGHAPVDVVVDAMGGFVDGPAGSLQVREGIRLAWSTSSQCPLDSGRRALRFLPDGRSCGGVLTMTGAGYETRLRVDWLTGRVELAAR